MAVESWPGLRVTYHAPDHDPLLLEAVRPALVAARPRVPGAFFTRHWLRGSHVRVWLPGSPDEPAVAAARAPLLSYLARRPSSVVLDPVELLAQHRVLARRERVTEPLTPFTPDNSVRLERFDRRAGILGGEEAAALLESFYAGTDDHCFDALDLVRRGADRRALALDLLWAVVLAPEAPLPRGYVSYRSHAEGFILGATTPDRMRETLERESARRRPVLLAALDRFLTGYGGPAARPTGRYGPVAGVLGVLRGLRPAIRELATAGGFALPLESAGGRRLWDPDLLRHSPFHQRLQGSPGYHRLLRDVDFAVERVLLNLVYLQLTRLGVRPAERSLLVQLAADTIEARLGTTAFDVIAELSA